MSDDSQPTIHRFEASLFPVNAYLIETRTGVVVVDATLGVTDGRALRARVNALKKPLAAVVTNGQACRQWLSAEPPNVERALLCADRVVRDGKAAADVIHRMRSLFKHAPLEMVALDLNDVIDEACSLMGDDVRARGVVLETPAGVARAQVRADRVQVLQVLVNLLRNGIEAMDPVADRPKRLIVATRVDGTEIAVEVIDEGVGIDDPDVVFDPLLTTKPGGMGMGLAICRSIIEPHGGRLWLARNFPHGSTFGFALPSAPRAEA